MPGVVCFRFHTLKLNEMGKREAILLLFWGVFYRRIYFAASENRSSIDESSLLALQKHINSDILAKNWSQETSFCSWIGVSCSRRHPRVIGLDLSSMGLRGTIAREIGNLSFLTVLDLSNNSINGLIPSEIGNLRSLRALDMALNQLNGHIPESLGLLRNLKNLSLSNNYLSGDIPRSLSTCVELNILNLSYNNLTGDIPAGIGNLSNLEYLYIMHNWLTGELPSAIFNISSLLWIDVGANQLSGTIPHTICNPATTKLIMLRLYYNQFEGEIPSTIMRCQSLKHLSLAVNKLEGNIPIEVWNLSAITGISLGRNKFIGTIPPSIGNLSNLIVFDIGVNSFHGTIPSELGQLSSLTILALQINELNGEVPQSIFNLSSLQTLSLAFNNLFGNLPFSIDRGLPNVEGLYLNKNQFQGKIPNSVSNLSRLSVLLLSSNSFTGDIPITLGNLRQLRSLSLGENQFTNNLSKPEQDFLSSLTTCEYLRYIRISFNPITGILPKSLGTGNLSTSLQLFVAYSCKIVSPLPNEIENLSSLFWLSLGSNDFTGAIPNALGNLTRLQYLELYGNKFQGSISPALCNLKSLNSIYLAGNDLSGNLPSCLGNLSWLREMHFFDNAFNSNIPSSLWFGERLEIIDLSNNFLDGSLSREIGRVKSLIKLDLSGNQLVGEIPSSISQLQNLINLSLSNNKFNGPILDSFADLKELQYLDLSHNKFSGAIPKSLETLSILNYFNVSFNELSGEIPDGGPFVNFTAELFTGNKGLCGAPHFKVEDCIRSLPAPSRKNLLLKYILPVIALVVMAALIVILVLRCRGRKLLPSSLSDLPLGPMHERISYFDILRATNNLDEKKIIGRGNFGLVYKGHFSDVMVAAIKVFNLEVQGALKSFDTECQIMRSIRHRHLIKVITSCSNLDFKALVMDYMPNGNLEKWLYFEQSSLNILQRLGIMIDVASALEYLHEGYTFPIVHCDLKPNNILLDEDMVAHVGDFGIAILLEEQRMQHTRTLGTVGYMAPEYGSEGLVSTMVDVYSYGILLIEIFSKRKPTDEMFSGELTMKRWVSKSFPSSILEIVDDELLKIDYERDRAKHESFLTSTIGLALECIADLPEERPNMKDVLVRIKKIKLNLSNSS